VKYDLVDRRCVVTGATSGIGKEIARNLAYFGATVVIAARNRDKGSATLQELVDDSGNDRLTMMEVDLSSQESIRGFVRRVSSAGPVHVLVNNAAVLLTDRLVTVDGHEMTWAVNGLAYFMLANLLLPVLRKNGPARVVNVASKLAGRLRVDDLDFEKRRFSGTQAYAQSKQANRMLSWGLASRIGSEVSVHACHPGTVATGLYRAHTGLRRGVYGLVQHFYRSPAEGAITPTYLAAAPEIHDLGGAFWVDQKPTPCRFRDAERIDALWSKCVEMTRTDV
jgi:NAD(P)-dependent dehydrogenase (short-subunit alcohol dehydrogenase family)